MHLLHSLPSFSTNHHCSLCLKVCVILSLLSAFKRHQELQAQDKHNGPSQEMQSRAVYERSLYFIDPTA